MNALPEQYLSLEEYFKLEETSDIKYEYFQGAVSAMTGASENHNLIYPSSAKKPVLPTHPWIRL